MKLAGILLFLSVLFVGCGLSQQTPAEAPYSGTTDRGFLVPSQPALIGTPKAVGNSFVQERIKIVNGMIPSDLRSRVGFGLSTRADASHWADELHAGWHIDWQVADWAPNESLSHWQMVRLSLSSLNGWIVHPTIDQVQKVAQKYPGQVWIIGNEPDVIWQDNLPPEVYAEAYHDLFEAIKLVDPSAKISPAAISQATDIRLAYLDRVLAEYQRKYDRSLPVDLWTVHGFVLREERGSWGVDIPPGFDYDQGRDYTVADHGRLDLFQQQIIDFRVWMMENGYRNFPLGLTEFGLLMPDRLGFTPEIREQYLMDTFDWLAIVKDSKIGYPEDENRLVQYWAWFSLADNLYPASDLADLSKGSLTALGRTFRDYMENNSTVR